MPCSQRRTRYNQYVALGEGGLRVQFPLDAISTAFFSDSIGVLSRKLATHGNKI